MLEINVPDTEDTKLRKKLNSTTCTLIMFLLVVVYELTLAILFLFFSLDVKPPECITLVNWNIALYVLYFLSALLNIIATIIQITTNMKDTENYIPKCIIGIRTAIHYITGIVILIGINVSYVNIPNIDVCGNNFVMLNYAYIILEWILIGGLTIFLIAMCILIIVMRKKRG